MDSPRNHGNYLREIHKIHRVLHIHKEFINGNGTSIFSVTTKVRDQDQICNTQNAVIMKTLLQQKRQIQGLEAECSLHQNMVHNLNRVSHSAASTLIMSLGSVPDKPKEEETVHQMLEDMDVESQDQPANVGQDEAHSKHVLH